MQIRFAPLLLLTSSISLAQVELPRAAFAAPEAPRPSFHLIGPLPLYGVPDSLGFPKWDERWVYESMNRARSDPQGEMTLCGAPCATDAHCYMTPKAPLAYDRAQLAHSARFHSDEMLIRNFFDHWSRCTLLATIGTTYPTVCDGAAACACAPASECGTSGCGTDPFTRMSYFGVNQMTFRAEIIDFESPTLTAKDAFEIWMYENYTGGLCTDDFISFTNQNGHRMTIMTFDGAVGVGENSNYATGDFVSGFPVPTKLASGSHYPQQASSIDFWANWYDTAGPMSATVVIDGCPRTMTLTRGTVTNGAYKATVTGLGSGCHRYYFSFKDSVGTTYTYPDTGSFAVGTGGGCPDYDASRPSDTPPVVTPPAGTTVVQTLCQ
jgi:hypothetical protein